MYRGYEDTCAGRYEDTYVEKYEDTIYGEVCGHM